MIRKGTRVEWNWRGATAYGKVVETFKEPVVRTIKGSKITRKGTPENKAVLIEQKDGDLVLKLESEIRKSK